MVSKIRTMLLLRNSSLPLSVVDIELCRSRPKTARHYGMSHGFKQSRGDAHTRNDAWASNSSYAVLTVCAYTPSETLLLREGAHIDSDVLRTRTWIVASNSRKPASRSPERGWDRQCNRLNWMCGARGVVSPPGVSTPSGDLLVLATLATDR